MLQQEELQVNYTVYRDGLVENKLQQKELQVNYRDGLVKNILYTIDKYLLGQLLTDTLTNIVRYCESQ